MTRDPASASGLSDTDSSDALPDFEAALAELERIVADLDGGELDLGESLAAFERGITLSRTCEAALTGAEARVQALLNELEGDAASSDGAPGGPLPPAAAEFEDGFLDEDFDPEFDEDEHEDGDDGF